jgi:hypothetical protein
MTKDEIKLVMQWCLPLDTTSKKLDELVETFANEHKEQLRIGGVSICYAVFDEEYNIVQLYQTEEKANKGLWEFQNSHPYTGFYVDTMQIN